MACIPWKQVNIYRSNETNYAMVAPAVGALP